MDLKEFIPKPKKLAVMPEDSVQLCYFHLLPRSYNHRLNINHFVMFIDLTATNRSSLH